MSKRVTHAERIQALEGDLAEVIKEIFRLTVARDQLTATLSLLAGDLDSELVKRRKVKNS
jgi:hypothetical protein